MDGNPNSKPLSTFDVARRADVDPRTVQRWAHSGLISGTMHVGRQYRFDPLSVEAQFATGRFPKNANDTNDTSDMGLT